MIADYVLQLFTGDDALRPKFYNPFDDGDYVYASDAHTMVRVEKTHLALDYTVDNKDKPNVSKFFNLEKDEENELKISTDKLAETLSRMKFRYKELECENCEGEGTVTCASCGHDHDCDDCDGTGCAGNYPFLVKVGANETEITLGKRRFRPHLVDRLLLAALASGEKEITLLNNKRDYNAAYFNVGIYQVLLMPLLEKK